MLGTFAVAISKSGITDLLARSVIKRLNGKESDASTTGLKYAVLVALVLVTMSSQNVIPVHIAFIPILIPPLLGVFAKLKLDRRLVACVLTFGLITPYMVLPVGFGGIFLNNILLKNLHDNGLESVVASQVPFGLLTAIFFSYRKPREYRETELTVVHEASEGINKKHILVAALGIIAALSVQLYTGSMIIGALAGFMVFTFGGVIAWKETHDVFTAAGFAAVMKQTGGVETLVQSLSTSIGDNKGLAALLMLVVGLLVTMGIGSSFSTIPILATISW